MGIAMKFLKVILIAISMNMNAWCGELSAPEKIQYDHHDYKFLTSQVNGSSGVFFYEPVTEEKENWQTEITLGQFSGYDTVLAYALPYSKMRSTPSVNEPRIDFPKSETQLNPKDATEATVEKYFESENSVEYSVTLVSKKAERSEINIYCFTAKSNVSVDEAKRWGASHYEDACRALKGLADTIPELNNAAATTENSTTRQLESSTTHQLVGEYLEIDVRKTGEAIEIFQSGSEKQKKRLRTKIEKHPSHYAPALFFHFAKYLFEQGEEDEALFWSFAGQLRTQYDIARCTDKSVEDSVQVLNRNLPQLLRLLPFEDIDNTKEVLETVVNWDSSTDYDYDCRWIALHGIKSHLPVAADGSDKPLSISEDRWEEVAEENRTKFYDEYVEALDDISERDLEKIQGKIEELRAAE